MHFLVTGHTGFKGSWLCLLLEQLGHEVSGISLAPVPEGLFTQAQVERKLKKHIILDIREREQLATAVGKLDPDVVIHMAAQPLVLESYADPVGTIDTNVTGTLNVLEACKGAPSVKVVLVITTDKVYKDLGTGSYSESSPLGGHDPYSASKAMADILSQSWMNLVTDFEIGVARAGNVIGIGDVSENRLLPDIMRAIMSGLAVEVRNPSAVRPWQHVLDCLSGYLTFVDYLLKKRGSPREAVMNFGPDSQSYKSVSEVVHMAKFLYPELDVSPVSSAHQGQIETDFLTLDSSLARGLLGWKDCLQFERAVEWSLAGLKQPDLAQLANDQILEFLTGAHHRD